MIAPLLLPLAKTLGSVVAKGVLDKLLASKGADSKFQRALEATEKGMSVIAALRGEFGDDFLKAVTNSVSDKGAHGFSYEAGGNDYIKVSIEAGDQSDLAMLRDELNVNLDRLTILGDIPEDAHRNYFRGILSIWKRRYVESIGIDEDANTTFAVMDELLDGSKRTFKDVLESLSKTGLGTAGALMVIGGVLLATSTGVGLVTAISTFLFGIPWLAVGALVIPGAILVALSRYKFVNKHAVTTCVTLAYKLLERRLETLPKVQP